MVRDGRGQQEEAGGRRGWRAWPGGLWQVSNEKEKEEPCFRDSRICESEQARGKKEREGKKGIEREKERESRRRREREEEKEKERQMTMKERMREDAREKEKRKRGMTRKSYRCTGARVCVA